MVPIVRRRPASSMFFPDVDRLFREMDEMMEDSFVQLSRPGTMEGIALVHFITDAPPLFVASMLGMGCGPLLALVASSCLKRNIDGNDSHSEPTMVNSNIFDYNHTLEEACLSIETFFQNNKYSYFEQFKSALHLWQRHRSQVWQAPSSIYGHYKNDAMYTDFNKATQISYRLSCTRSHSKKYAHKREDLLPCLGDWLIPVDELNRTNFLDDILKQGAETGTINNNTESSNETTPWKWVVDLKYYDVEIVSMIHCGCLTVAIPLRPYQWWGSKSYRSNSLPVDGSGSFGRLGPKRSLGRYVHLRPSTADILISIADLSPHSIILDPCAGIGTINIRASFQHYGLGGDIVPSLFGDHAPYFLECNNNFQQKQSRGAVDMTGWDATMLPLRDAFVDAVVSDVPFGQRCLTHNELHSFMSGFIYECARVLVKYTGKMVLLCGDCEIIQSTITSLNERSARRMDASCSDSVFHIPCQSAFPVTISGILAWVIVVRRGNGKPFPSTSYRVCAKPKDRLSYARK